MRRPIAVALAVVLLASICLFLARNNETVANSLRSTSTGIHADTTTPRNTVNKWGLDVPSWLAGHVDASPMNVNENELDIDFFRNISDLQYNCSQSVRLGKRGDGGWNACISEPFSIRRPCLVYSFGINYDFSFDDAVSQNFGCVVRAFDPSMRRARSSKRGASVWFYKIGIGDSDMTDAHGWTLATLSSLLEKFNETQSVIDYLKMDVEGAEWPSLTNMFKSGVLNKVKQLGLEIHVFRNPRHYLYLWSILGRLQELGFRRWRFSINTIGGNKYRVNGKLRSNCYEMIYVNSKFELDTQAKPSIK